MVQYDLYGEFADRFTERVTDYHVPGDPSEGRELGQSGIEEFMNQTPIRL
ncbi:hypothetical protein [Amycolatopsis sp. NPDC054798]